MNLCKGGVHQEEGKENFLGDKTEDGREEVRSGGSGSPLRGSGCGDLGKVRNTPTSLENFQFGGTYFLCWGIQSGKYCKPLSKIFTFHGAGMTWSHTVCNLDSQRELRKKQEGH